MIEIPGVPALSPQDIVHLMNMEKALCDMKYRELNTNPEVDEMCDTLSVAIQGLHRVITKLRTRIPVEIKPT